MSASFQAKNPQVLSGQLKVQELCLFANDALISVVGGDLQVAINEPILSVLMVVKQIAAGTISGVVPSVASVSNIVLTGESAAAASTSYCIKYIVKES